MVTNVFQVLVVVQVDTLAANKEEEVAVEEIRGINRINFV